MSVPTLTIALANFDRHVPFFLDWLTPAEGFRLKALDVGMTPAGRDGGDRHGRMLRDGEFDIAELSLASYVMARARGSALTAVPVFPRRLFSQNHILVRRDAGIREPRDLIGRRVGLRAFQVTLSVLARSDLKSVYGVPWEAIRWVVQEPEEIAWDGSGLPIERMPPGRKGAEMLLAGEIDALIDPRPPASVLDADAVVRPLFDDPRAECERTFRERGGFPIMHVLALKADRAEEFPHLPAYLIAAWEEAKRKANAAYEDFAHTLLPFGRHAYVEDRKRFGPDPWPSGLAANRANLSWFLDAMVDQRLLTQAPLVDELFHPSVRAT